MGKHIMLTLNPEMFAIVEQKAKAKIMSVQEFIIDTLRTNILQTSEPHKKSKAGRPHKIDDQFIEYFSRKR